MRSPRHLMVKTVSPFGKDLTDAVEELIAHVLVMAGRVPRCFSEPDMTREEAEQIVVMLLTERCYYWGETREEEFVDMAWREVRGGAR